MSATHMGSTPSPAESHLAELLSRRETVRSKLQRIRSGIRHLVDQDLARPRITAVPIDDDLADAAGFNVAACRILDTANVAIDVGPQAAEFEAKIRIHEFAVFEDKVCCVT